MAALMLRVEPDGSVNITGSVRITHHSGVRLELAEDGTLSHIAAPARGVRLELAEDGTHIAAPALRADDGEDEPSDPASSMAPRPAAPFPPPGPPGPPLRSPPPPRPTALRNYIALRELHGTVFARRVGSLPDAHFRAYTAACDGIQADRLMRRDAKGKAEYSYQLPASAAPALKAALDAAGVPWQYLAPPAPLRTAFVRMWNALDAAAKFVGPGVAEVEGSRAELATLCGGVCARWLRMMLRFMETLGCARRISRRRVHLYPDVYPAALKRIEAAAACGSADPRKRTSGSAPDLFFRSTSTDPVSSSTPRDPLGAGAEDPGRGSVVDLRSADPASVESGSTSASPGSVDPLPAADPPVPAAVRRGEGDRSSPTPSASSPVAMDLARAGASTTPAPAGSSPALGSRPSACDPSASSRAAARPSAGDDDRAARGAPAAQDPSIAQDQSPQELLHLAAAPSAPRSSRGPGPSGYGQTMRSSSQPAADAPLVGQALWRRLTEQLTRQEPLNGLWLNLLHCCDAGRGHLVLRAPDDATRQLVEQACGSSLRALAKRLTGLATEIAWLEPADGGVHAAER